MFNITTNNAMPGSVAPAMQRVLHWAAAAFLLIAPFTSSVAIRNIALGIALIAAIATVFYVPGRIPKLPRSIAVAAMAWILVCVASWLWSIDRSYTASELRPELLFPLIVFCVIWIGASRDGVRLWVSTLLLSGSVMGMLALGEWVLTKNWDAGRWHAGVGAYSTWLIMIFPLILVLALPRDVTPIELGRHRWMLFVLVLALVGGSAYLTLNRIVWPAFGAVLFVFGILCLLKDRIPAHDRRGLLAAVIMVFIGVAVSFALTLKGRHASNVVSTAPIAMAVQKDERLTLWRHAIERIPEAPIIGHGFGRGILRQEFQSSLGSPLLWHGHNIVINVLLQTGAIGLLVFIALLGAFVFRYIAYVRASSSQLNAIGIVGLAFFAGFFVKNLTDDFLIRHTGLLFWAINAMLIGYGERLLNSDRNQTA